MILEGVELLNRNEVIGSRSRGRGRGTCGGGVPSPSMILGSAVE
jgi:hypothetical protein